MHYYTFYNCKGLQLYMCISVQKPRKEKKEMAKDPVCGMFVEEKPESIRYTKDGKRCCKKSFK
jgi:hypothetical protein